MDLAFQDRVVLVTGGSSGIGLATVDLLVAEGARVATCSRNEQRLEAAIEPYGSRVFALPCDVTDANQVARFCTAAGNHFGRIDGVATIAGQGRRGSALETAIGIWQDELANKAAGTLNPVRAALPYLRQSDAARVVTLTSVNATEPDVALAASSASRAMVSSVTKSLAAELAGDRILVNAVAVGLIDTDRQRRLHRAVAVNRPYEKWLLDETKRRGVLLSRPGRPEEVACQVGWLLSPRMSYTTGSTFDVDGGSRRAI